MRTTVEDDDDDGPPSPKKGATFSFVLLAHTANAHTVLVSKMKEIAICKIPHCNSWPAFAIFVSLASEGVRTQSPSSAFFSPNIPHTLTANVRAYQLVLSI
jgi:hypothetical protein